MRFNFCGFCVDNLFEYVEIVFFFNLPVPQALDLNACCGSTCLVFHLFLGRPRLLIP
jgi:hypothetical protein